MTEGTWPGERGAEAVITVRSPATGEPLGEVPVLGAEAVRAAVERAREAQRAWGSLSLEARAERVARVGRAYVQHAEGLVEAIVRETGKPRLEALAHEVTVLADLCHHYTRRAAKILEDRPIELHLLRHRKSYVRYVPRGVVGVISPWNFPLVIPLGSAMEALLAGNGVVLKPSEATPLVALRARDLAVEAGIPEGLFQVVTGDGTTGEALVDAGVDLVVFTGSVSAGRRVAARCGERLTPCVLELGGKAPLLALEDCDVERTARAVVFGGFANAGQVCASVERVYAHEAVHDALASRVVELTRALRVGDATRDEVDVGPLIHPKQVDVIEGHLADALSRGATLAVGGRRLYGHGRYFEPTVLLGCDPTMTVMREEVFGPVVPMMKVRDDEEALRLANDSHLGLHAYVFSQDEARALALAERIEAGTVMVNDVLSSYAAVEAPFGGIKSSGYGCVHSDESLRGMCHARHVNHERLAMPSRDPLWYPYTQTMYRLALGATRVMFGRHGFFGRIADLF